MAVRQMLLELEKVGVDVQILGATIFDHERGTAGLEGYWKSIKSHPGKFLNIADGPLRHTLMITNVTRRSRMLAEEEGKWHLQYEKTLDTFKPDLVYFYGGGTLDLLLSADAKHRGIPVAFYLANGNYHGHRWYRDLDVILTDSQATADMYRERLGIDVTPIGAFIDPARVVAPAHTRQRLLMVNPSMEKGAGIVARLALMMEHRRPDIQFEVVESRGSWAEVVRAVTASTGKPRDTLSNVVVTAHTTDMRPLYGRAKLLLAPSLWWESSGRVLAEAMLNGVPALITDRGGMPEMVGDAAIKFQLDDRFHEKPYNRLPGPEALLPLVERIEALYDNEKLYAGLVARAKKIGRERHGLDVSTKRLIQALTPWLVKRAGDRQHNADLITVVDENEGP